MEILNLQQAAQFLQISPATLRAKAKAGKAPGSKATGRWRFRKEDLYNWLEPQNKKGSKQWDSTNVEKPGGSTSQHQTDKEYRNLLGLPKK